MAGSKSVSQMNHLDLFSGIGGFSLGLERVGFNTIAFCERDRYCQLLLQKHWKGVKIYDDITKLEGKDIKEPVDILTGGFPCQPYSVAGKQKGTRDDRYLWPEMFRVIKEVQPTFVIAENVRGLINIQDGMVFETVCSNLESEGFEVQTFIIPAAGVGAPHKRERVWIVGYSEYNGSSPAKIERGHDEVNARSQKRQNQTIESERTSRSNNNEIMENSRRSLRQRSSIREKNADEVGEEVTNQHQRSNSSSKSNVANSESFSSYGRKFQSSKEKSGQEGSTRIETRRINSYESDRNWWFVEPDVGRVAHGIPGRSHRLKGLGNAIVPQIAEEIGRAIQKVLTS